jgi:hypothetical protein
MRVLRLALATLTVALGAAGARSDLVHYSWSGRVESVPGDSNPWFLSGDRLAATPDDGTLFTIEAVVEADAFDHEATVANVAIFAPAYVTLTIGGPKVLVSAPQLDLVNDEGLVDSIRLSAVVEQFGTALSFTSAVRLAPATFALASSPAADPPPVFAGTVPISFTGELVSRLITFPQNAPVTSRYEPCGQDSNLPVPVDWTTPTTGTADGLGVAVDGLSGPRLDRFDLKGEAFEAAEQCSTAQVIAHATRSDWTLTLSAPARTLLLYVYGWRGPGAGVDPATFQFDAPFTIRSGLTGATVENGRTRLSLPATAFHDGILRFDGPISSLSVETDSNAIGEQGLTFALIPERPAVTYAVDRTLGPSVLEDALTVTGTVTVDEAGVVTDWELTIASALLGRAMTLDPDNSTFQSRHTTVTPSATQLTIDSGESGGWGAQLRDDSISLRHEWFLAEETTFGEQASLNFAEPDPDADFVNIPRANPLVLFVVPEPSAGTGALASLAALGGLRRRGRGARS